MCFIDLNCSVHISMHIVKQVYRNVAEEICKLNRKFP